MDSPGTVRGAVPLVIGVGSEDRADDRCGLEVARIVRARGRRTVRVAEAPGDPMTLLDLWQDATHVIVVDAVRSGAPAGTVLRFDAGTRGVPVPGGVASTHGLSIAEAFALARALGRLPAHLTVVGIEVGDLGPSDALTAPVAAAIAPAVDLVEAELARWADPAVEG